MLRLLPLLLATPLVIGYGLREGQWTQRWALSPELEQAAEKLARVPDAVGPWAGKDLELDARQLRQGDIRAYLQRVYVHGPTNERVTVLVVCGRPGPIAVHNPQTCFGGAGFQLMADPRREAVEAPALRGRAEFWRGMFHKTDGGLPEQTELYWAWNPHGDWVAADKPRLQFAPERALYKVYVLRQVARADEAPEDSPVPDFLKLFLPQLNDALFPPAS